MQMIRKLVTYQLGDNFFHLPTWETNNPTVESPNFKGTQKVKIFHIARILGASYTYILSTVYSKIFSTVLDKTS